MRLIDAEKLRSEGLRVSCGINDKGIIFVPMKDIHKSIDNAPTVDAVEVVRCRDCSRANQYDDGSDNFVCSLGGTKKGSGYCSDGERRK